MLFVLPASPFAPRPRNPEYFESPPMFARPPRCLSNVLVNEELDLSPPRKRYGSYNWLERSRQTFKASMDARKQAGNYDD